MRNLILVVLLLCLGCESQQDVKSDLNRLRAERNTSEIALRELSNREEILKTQLKKLTEELLEANIWTSGRIPKYILELELSQSHFTLDIGTHMKDSMNTCTFTIPVDKEMYDKVKVGTRLVDEFRAGSFIMNGSFGDWNVKVVGKEIK